MIIIQDTREQRPWQFPPYVQVTTATLKDGDYTVQGYEDSIRVERKSLEDLASCLCDKELRRFCGQLQRMRKYKYRSLIVEGTIQDMLSGCYRSPLPPDKVITRLMDVTCRFKILLFIAGHKKSSAKVAEQFMRSAVKQLDQG